MATPREWRGIKTPCKLKWLTGGQCTLTDSTRTKATVRFPSGNVYVYSWDEIYTKAVPA